MKNFSKQSRFCFAACLLSAGFAPSVLAQAVSDADAIMDDAGEVIEEIITTGTRRTRMAVSSSPAPIQLINAEVLKESGAPDLMNTLAMQVPSYNANQRGGDAANQTLTASMRSLSPNHALVLVNGKRRHTTSNVGAASGSAAADLSFIPTSAIARVEVLTDGAAALYGSDAIAGVINIVLDEDYSSGGVRTNISEYTDGGGFTTNVQGKAGFGSDAAYVNLSMEVEDRETISRSVVYGPAVCVANATECLNRLNNRSPSGYTVSSANRTYLQRDSAMQFHPDYPAINRVGDPPAIKRQAFFFNAGYSLGDTTELYSFGSIGRKEAASFQTYRRPSQDGGVDVNGDGRRSGSELLINKYMYGFNPMQESDESDYALTLGAKGTNLGWTWDVASTYGDNEMDYYTTESMNFTMWNETGASPSDFYDGTFWANQWTTTFDASKDFDIGIFDEPMTLASGLEYRKSEYGIDGGDPASYYGSGAASFPGYNPAVNTGAYDRDSYSAYANVIVLPTDSWLVDLAVRYENYSDFGNETIGKITTRYDLLDNLAFRGTASTGFRAPTLGEGYYSAVNVGPTSASPQLQPNGAGAAALGFGAGLQPETSENFSFGLVFTPIEGLTTTIDAYQITIKDRIQRGSLSFSTQQSLTTATGRTTGSFNNILPDPADTNGDGTPDASFNEPLGKALVDFGYIGVWNDPAAPGGSLDPSARASINVSLFNNALDTRSSGIDWVTTYSSHFDLASIDWTVAANYNKTEVLNAKAAPVELGGAVLYSPLTLSNLETDNPEWRLNVGARITFGNFNLGIRQMFYGPQYSLTTIAGLPASVVSQLDTVKLGSGTFYKNEIGLMNMTNIELNYEMSENLNFGIGADNIFNQYPDKTPDPVWNYNEEIYGNTNRQYLIGSPIGYFGMRWFAKAAYTF